MDRVVVVGAGIGGLACALDLAARGCAVTLLERAAEPGGKMRELIVGSRPVDAGPTVFTMRWVFEELFADAGATLDSHVTLHPAELLARHAWDADTRLDLHADPARSADAIGQLAGAAEARGFLTFCAEARRVYETLDAPFIRGPLRSPVGLAMAVGNPARLLGIRPFQTMWDAISAHMHDPRLRQLFGRYATYCGSSPFAAPATLMLVAHVEQQGVWLVAGGMHRLAAALAGLAASRGAVLRYGTAVAEVLVDRGRASGVRLETGERIPADAVVLNADPGAVAAGLLGNAVRHATPATPPAARSLSAVTFAVEAQACGFPLARHNVFFSADSRAEFAALGRGERPEDPTVYVCAQDRGEPGQAPGEVSDGPERLLLLANAPADGDKGGDKTGDNWRDTNDAEIAQCLSRVLDRVGRCGLRLHLGETAATGPAQFHRLFPGTGGALYGSAVHGPLATFRRPGSRTRVPALYLAGGATHPGAGVPMAALSGRLAASALMADLASSRPSRRTAMSGGTSMR